MFGSGDSKSLAIKRFVRRARTLLLRNRLPAGERLDVSGGIGPDSVLLARLPERGRVRTGDALEGEDKVFLKPLAQLLVRQFVLFPHVQHFVDALA